MDPCSQVGHAKTKTIRFSGTLRHVVCLSFGEGHFEALEMSQQHAASIATRNQSSHPHTQTSQIM
jgi:hypothetical protein